MPAVRSSRKAGSKAPPPLNPRTPCSAWWCTKTFNRNPDMEKHANHKHLGIFYRCTYEKCGYKAAQKDAVETHVYNVHTREQYSVCSCGESFTDPSTLSRHRKATVHAAVRNARRPPSGYVERAREPGTEHLTHELIEKQSYKPALESEDTFSFAVSPSATSDKSLSPGSFSVLSTPPLFPASLTSSCSTQFVVPSTPSPKLYEPTTPLIPEVPWTHIPDFSLEANIPFDQFSFCELDPSPLTFVPEDYSSYFHPTQDLDYFGQSLDPFGLSNFTGLDFVVQNDFVSGVQDNFLQQMAYTQNPPLDFNYMPNLFPIYQPTQLSFEPDLTRCF